MSAGMEVLVNEARRVGRLAEGSMRDEAAGVFERFKEMLLRL